MKEKEGYKFLSKTLSTEDMIEKFKKEQKPIQSKISINEEGEEEENNMEHLDFVSVPADQQQETMEALTYFLDNIDKRHLQPKYPYKKNSDKYDSEEKKAHEFMLEEMKKMEEIVSKRLVKYPVEYVQGLRVEEFHSRMTFFFGNLLVKMIQLQDYHIDMRNWHGCFSMPGLKKTLDTKVISNKG